MLAGPSEVLVIAGATADVETVAADLLVQVRTSQMSISNLLIWGLSTGISPRSSK